MLQLFQCHFSIIFARTVTLSLDNIRVHVCQKFKCAFKSHFHPVTGHRLLKEDSQAAEYAAGKTRAFKSLFEVELASTDKLDIASLQNKTSLQEELR